MFAGAGGGLGLLFVVVWASAFTAVRGVVPEWPALWALAIRFVLVVPILLAIVAARRSRWPARRDLPRVAAMGLGSAGYLAGAWSATALIPSGLVALLSATAPLFVAAGERVFAGRRLPARAWAGLALGWAGVAVLGAGRASAAAAEGAPLGLALALAGALSQAAGLLAFAPARARVDRWAANAMQTAVGAAALVLVAAVAAPGLPGPPSGLAAFALGYSVLVVGVGAYALMFTLLERLPASSAAALQLLAPPLAAVFGTVLFNERLAWTDVLGGCVTLVGLALLFRARA